MSNAIFSLVSVVMVNISKFTVKDGGYPFRDYEPYHGGISANGRFQHGGIAFMRYDEEFGCMNLFSSHLLMHFLLVKTLERG